MNVWDWSTIQPVVTFFDNCSKLVYPVLVWFELLRFFCRPVVFAQKVLTNCNLSNRNLTSLCKCNWIELNKWLLLQMERLQWHHKYWLRLRKNNWSKPKYLLHCIVFLIFSTILDTVNVQGISLKTLFGCHCVLHYKNKKKVLFN